VIRVEIEDIEVIVAYKTDLLPGRVYFPILYSLYFTFYESGCFVRISNICVKSFHMILSWA